jgi:hypothetical protein
VSAPKVRVRLMDEPFCHASATAVFPPDLSLAALAWLEGKAPWILRVASFYEQWELHLEPVGLPEELHMLCSPDTIGMMVDTVIRPLCNNAKVVLTEVTAHKLLAGQTIRVHNDFLDSEENYRLLVQLNRGWVDEQGGLLMLFSSASAGDVRRVLRPVHGSVFAFKITPASYHAVSTIHSGERYTLVYSFKEIRAHKS